MVISHLFFSSSRAPVATPLHSSFLAAQFKSNYSKKNQEFKVSKVANEARRSKRLICHAIHMENGHSREPNKLNFDRLLSKTKDIWNNSPKPIKEFPWNRAFDNFIQLILDLTIAVVKYLFVPILAVTSISEMSYCAHERKLALVPFPLVIGMVLAGILQDTAVKISPRLKETEVPWHMIAIMIFFSLIKLPGPYYPYWGRLVLPHFANGVLFRTLWSLFFWYKKPRSTGNLRKNQNLET